MTDHRVPVDAAPRCLICRAPATIRVWWMPGMFTPADPDPDHFCDEHEGRINVDTAATIERLP